MDDVSTGKGIQCLFIWSLLCWCIEGACNIPHSPPSPVFFFLYSSICLSLIFKSFYLLPEPPIFSESPRFVYLSPQCKYDCDKNVCDRTSPFLITKPLNSLIFKTIIGTRWYFCCAIYSSPPPPAIFIK